MKDVAITAALALGLATLVTVHVALSVRLLLHRPRWRGPVALLVPPLALIWAFRAGWKGIAMLWLGALAVYAIALTVALTGAKT